MCLEEALFESEDGRRFPSSSSPERVRGTCRAPGGPGEKGAKGQVNLEEDSKLGESVISREVG